MPKTVSINENRLRELIREEYFKGVQEFVLRGETNKFVSSLREHLKRYIFTNLSHSKAERNEALKALDETLLKLEHDVNDLMEDALLRFTRQI